MQLVGDCWSIGDWSGITGNLAKLLLGFVSITFDTIFMLQHYIWYANEEDSLPTESLLTASLIEDQILL
jgi:cystinosin